MEWILNLPLSNEHVRLVVTGKEFENETFIPPLFKNPLKNEDIDSKPKYIIHLLVSKYKKFSGNILYNYKNKLIHIYENKGNVFVHIGEDEILEKQYLSQIGISIALSWILCKENIYTLHSASIMIKGHGFLFLGLSGTGKTTLSRLSEKKGNLVLCDELSAIKWIFENNNRKWYVFPGPRWSRFTFNPKYYLEPSWNDSTGWTFPLKAVFFLDKRKEKNITTLSKEKKINTAHLLNFLFYNSRYTEILPIECRKEVFHNLANLAREIPCYRISINLKDDFWKKIDKVVGI